MSTTRTRGRLALAAVLATAAIGGASPAYADVETTRIDCDTRLERLETRFREVEERRGYEAATEWWEKRWAAYHKKCVL